MSQPLRVAVIGAGPSGLYAVDALLSQDRIPVLVDVIDRLPTPYGLVRYGVAPDHEKMKNVISTLSRVFDDERVTFYGNVEIGRDISSEHLDEAYDAVIHASGASVDTRLGIPGEDLANSVSATSLVAWYTGHPDATVPADLSVDAAVVVGAGNVAVDVTRTLTKPVDELARTEMPDDVLQALRRSAIRTVHVLVRRGPADAKWTHKELRELGELPGVDVVVDPADMPAAVDPEWPRPLRSCVETLIEWSARPAPTAQRRIVMHFNTRPVELTGDGRVEQVVVERTRLEGGRVVGTGELATLDAGLVVRSVGYRVDPPEPLVLADGDNRVAHSDGRAHDRAGNPIPGRYVAGWLKRGPSGIIGTNKGDAAATVATLLDDADSDVLSRGSAGIDTVVHEKVVDYRRWLAIDAQEIADGQAQGRGRRKLHSWPSLLGAAGHD